MTKRQTPALALGLALILAVALVAGLVPAGCRSAAPEAEKPWSGHTLNVAVWNGPFMDYFEQTVSGPFEELTGAQVLLTGHWGEVTSKILAAPADNPPYDVIFGESMVYSMARANDLLLPVRPGNVPNLADVWVPCKTMPAVAEGYGVPFDFGHNVMVYIPANLGFELTSWTDLLRPELKGKVALSRNYWVENLYMAAQVMDEEPGPGEIYTDLDGVFAKLEEFVPQVGFWYEGGADAVAALTQKEVLVANYYMEYALQSDLYDLGVRATVPKEGGTGYLDYFMVVRGTRERDLAEAFIDFATAAEQETAFTAFQMTQPANRLATIPERGRPFYASDDAGWEKQIANIVDYNCFGDRFNAVHERYVREILQSSEGGQ